MMSFQPNEPNVVLIGMPGAGKSTVGVILAKHTSRDFVDTDVLIQVREGRTLQQIVDVEGQMELRRIEEAVLLSLNCQNHVIATGGSAVYSDVAMQHLKASGLAVFLHVEIEELRKRLSNFETRGIARRPDQTFEDLFSERLVLYRQYADLTINCMDKPQENLSREIHEGLLGRTEANRRASGGEG